MNLKINCYLSLALIFIPIRGLADGVEIRYIESSVHPKPIVAIQPVYPRRAVEIGREGYVVVNFTIDKEGSVQDPVVAESTHSVFENSAINAAKKLKYPPRIENGVPVEVNHYYKFTWEMVDSPDYWKFKRDYKEFQHSFQEGDAQGAAIALEKLGGYSKPVHRAYFNFASFLHSSKFKVYQEKQIDFLELATVEKYGEEQKYYLADQVLKPSLSKLFELQVQNNLLEEALNTYGKLEALGFDDIVELHRSTKDSIVELKGSEQSYAVNMMSDLHGRASIALFRRSFSLDSADGNIRDLLLDCENRAAQMNFVEGYEYSIPDGWSSCTLVVKGAPETEFTYIQY